MSMYQSHNSIARINGTLVFAALNSLLAAGILFKLDFGKTALVLMVLFTLSSAMLAYLYICRMCLLIKKKFTKGNK